VRAKYGSVIGEARRLLEEKGVCTTWELARVRSGSGHALKRLVGMGEAVQVRGSTLYARPDVAKAIESAIGGAS